MLKINKSVLKIHKMMLKINIVATRHHPITSHNICTDVHYTKHLFDMLNMIAKVRSVQ